MRGRTMSPRARVWAVAYGMLIGALLAVLLIHFFGDAMIAGIAAAVPDQVGVGNNAVCFLAGTILVEVLLLIVYTVAAVSAQRALAGTVTWLQIAIDLLPAVVLANWIAFAYLLIRLINGDMRWNYWIRVLSWSSIPLMVPIALLNAAGRPSLIRWWLGRRGPPSG